MGWILTILLGIAGAYIGSLAAMLSLARTVMVSVVLDHRRDRAALHLRAVRSKTAKPAS